MKRSLIALMLISIFCCSTVRPVHAAGYFKSLSIPQIPQEKNYYCGVALTQMWVKWLHGSAPSQNTIASDQGVTSSDGLNADDMANALEDYSSHWFDKYKNSSKESFAMKICSEVQGGSPLAVMANTRRRDGSVTQCGHWLLVDSFWESTTSYSTSYSSLNGFYMNDPLYNSAYTSTYYYITPTTYVDKGTFFNTMVSKCPNSDSYYGAED